MCEKWAVSKLQYAALQQVLHTVSYDKKFAKQNKQNKEKIKQHKKNTTKTNKKEVKNKQKL